MIEKDFFSDMCVIANQIMTSVREEGGSEIFSFA